MDATTAVYSAARTDGDSSAPWVQILAHAN